MARLPYLTKADLAPDDQDVLEREINLNRILAHSPKAARAFGRLGGFIRFQSKLNPRLRELAILQVGYLARSPYEYSHHIKLGREFGVSDDDIRALAEESAGRPTPLEPLARAVLAAARQLTTGLTVASDTFAELSGELGAELVLDLLMTISFYNGVVRLLGAVEMDVEPEYLRYLEEFPLPSG